MSNLLKKIAIGSAIVGFAAVSLPAFGVVSDACKADLNQCTTEELSEYIAQLSATLQALQSQLSALQGQGTTPTTPTASNYTGIPAGFTFTKNLYQGMRDQDVVYLKKVLDVEVPDHAPWTGSSYFGSKTKAAVIAFQTKYKTEISNYAGYTIHCTGFVGKGTRAQLNALLSAGSTSPQPTSCSTDADCDTGYKCQAGSCVKKSADEITAENECTAVGYYWYNNACHEEAQPAQAGLTVALADDTPGAAIIPDGSLYNPVLKLDFTAGGQEVVVTGVTITRGGYIENTNITGISAWDEEGNRLGNIVTALTADGKATIDFGSNDLVIGDGETKSVTIKVNIAADTNSGTLNFKVASKDDIAVEDGVTINGTFPIVSNTMSITNGESSLGDVRVRAISVGALDSSSAQSGSGNVKVGDENVTIAKFRFTQNNSKEAIQIEKVVVYVEGTVNEDKDLKNFELYAPDGTLLASAEKAVDRYVTFNLDTPYEIPKGMTKDLTVKVDIVDGSTHYFRAQIQNDYDVMIKGKTTGAYLVPEDSDGDAFDAGTDGANANSYFRIKVGDLTVSKAATSPTGNVSPGDQDVVLAKFNLKAVGEKLELRKMNIAVYRTGATALTGSVKVRDADTGTTYLSVAASDPGLQITSAVTSTDSLDTQNLSTYIVIGSGETKTIEITGTISSNATSGNTYTVYVGKFYAKRYSSNDYTYLPDSTTPYAANALQVGGVSLSVNPNAAFTGKRVAKGSTAAQVGEFVLGASSADDIRISSIQMKYSTTTGIQNVYLAKEDGTQLGDTVGTPSASGDSISVALTIPKNTSQILKVFADVTTDASDGDFYVYIPANGITAYGVNSSKDASGPDSNVTSSSVTVGSASLTISRAADAPSSQIVLAGEDGVVLDKIKFEASYEDLTLKEITLQLTSASTTLWSYTTSVAANIEKVYLYDGDTLLNEGGTPVANGQVAITGLNVTLPADSTKVLTVKADITGSGTLTSKSVGGIKVYPTSTDYLAVYSSTGLMSSGITLTTTTADATSYAQSNYFLFTDAAPTVTVPSGWDGTRTGSPAGQEPIAKYTVTNNGSRTLTLTDLDLTVTLSGVSSNTSTVKNFRLYDSSDTLIATSTTDVANATTVTVTFDIDGYGTIEEIAANGGSETYTIKADTTSIEAGESNPAQTTARLSTSIGGSKGYSSTDTTGDDELYWADSDITYKYTPSGKSPETGLKACDSVTVYGATLQY